MAWFKSRRQPGGDQQMDYLNATDTTVRPLALPSLLVALLLVSAIAFLLFVIGRWGYQELSKNDAPTSSEVSSTDGSGNTDTNTGDGSSGQNTDTSDSQSGDNANGTTDSSTSGNGTTGTTGSDNSSGSSASTSTNSSSTSTTAQTESIPNTGPSSLVGVFAVTVALSSASYYAVTIRSIKRSL